MNLREIVTLLGEIHDYEFIPHFGNGIDHNELVIENGHLGLCTCLFKSLLLESYKTIKQDGELSEKYDACIFVVLVVPDDVTCWNILRKLTTEENTDFLFNLSKIVLLRKSNCGAVLVFREWLLLRQSPPNVERLKDSLELCAEICDNRRSNYVAWNHRRFLYDLLETHYHSTSIFKQELDVNRMWLESHVSDSSAWSYRIFLLRRLKILRICHLPSIIGDDPLLLVHETLWALNFLRVFFTHECIWNYIRILLRNIKCFSPCPEMKQIDLIVQDAIVKATRIGGWSDTLARRFQRTLSSFPSQSNENEEPASV